MAFVGQTVPHPPPLLRGVASSRKLLAVGCDGCEEVGPVLLGWGGAVGSGSGLGGQSPPAALDPSPPETQAAFGTGWVSQNPQLSESCEAHQSLFFHQELGDTPCIA